MSTFNPMIFLTKKGKRNILIFTLLCFYCFFFFSSSGINSSNDAGHIALAYAMYQDHTVCLNDYAETIVWKPDYAVKDGNIYSDRLPGNAFLMIPFMVNFDIVSAIIPGLPDQTLPYAVVAMTLLPNLCGVLGLLMLFLLCYRFFFLGYKSSLLCMVIAGFCTLLHLESIHLYSHAPSMCLLTFGVLLALQSKEKKDWKKYLYSLVFVVSLSTLVELQNLLYLVPLTLYVFHVNGIFTAKRFREALLPLTISFGIFAAFISVLLVYNYIAFGELLLKSNTYNPFFTEEQSFITALSGNFWEGFGELFVNTYQLESFWNWSAGLGNDIPGVLNVNPVFVFSILGFIPFYKQHRIEAILFIAMITIAVMIAAFHVTTLVRHIFTIHLLLFFPLVFFVDKIKTMSGTKKLFYWSSVTVVIVYSFVRQQYVSNHYFTRDFSFGTMPYLSNWEWFILLNIPITIMVLIVFLLLKHIGYLKTL